MTRVVPEPLARGAFLPFVEQLANLIQLLRGGRPGGEGLQDELERRAVQPKSWRLDARDRLGARRELGQPRGLGQERVRAVEPVLLAALHHVDLAGQSEKRGRPVPGEDTLVEQARRAGEERLLHLRRLRGQRLMVQPVTPGGGQEHAGVELQRPSPETLPVDHAHCISLVENMTGVKRAVNEAPNRSWEASASVFGPAASRPLRARGPMARTGSERSRARSGCTRTGPSPTSPTAARASYSSVSGSGSSPYSLSAK